MVEVMIVFISTIGGLIFALRFITPLIVLFVYRLSSKIIPKQTQEQQRTNFQVVVGQNIGNYSFICAVCSQ